MNYVSRLITIFGTRSLLKGTLVFALIACSAMLEMVGIGVIFPFLQLLAAPEAALSKPWLKRAYELSAAGNTETFLIYLSMVLIGFVIFKGLFSVATTYITQRIVQNERARLSSYLIGAYMTAPWELHIQRNSAVLVRNVVKSIEGAFSDFINPLLANLADVLLVVAVGGVLLFVQPMVTVFVAGVLLALTVPFYKSFKDKAGRWGALSHQNEANMLRWLTEGLGSLKELKVYGRESFVLAGFSREAFAKARHYTLLQTICVAPRAVIEIVMIVGMVSVILLLQMQAHSLQEAIPTLGLFGVAAFRLVPSVSRLANGFVTMKYGAAALDQIYDDVVLHEARTARRDHDRNHDTLKFTKDIVLERVTFCYPKRETAAVSDVSLTIERGQLMALVGPSGSGKTTLVDLILGILPPSSGSIKVDGQNIATHLRGWQRNIGYVPQTIFLSDASLRSNIAFAIADEDVDDRRVQEVVGLAGLDDIVRGLPQGLATNVGDRGICLSGGQRQRVGIARALYGNPDLLVLDEATSALDAISERQIARTLDRLRGMVTILVIAHRLTTVQWCDQLVFLKNGRVSGVGRYDHLASEHAEFRHFVQGGKSQEPI